MTHSPSEEQLDRLLGDFIERVTHVSAIVLASADGLHAASSGFDDPDDADRLSSVSSSLFSLDPVISRLSRGRTGNVRQITIEAEGGLMFVAYTAADLLLTVLTSREGDHDLIRNEMRLLDQEVGVVFRIV